MRKTLATLALAFAPLWLACKPDFADLRLLDVDGLVSLRGERADVLLLDANNDDTRSRYGVIPGAVLLTSYRDYDPTRELPQDKHRRLVFYCHSDMCGAAADAARKAIASGHAEVWVLAAGIVGWVEAGQPVDAGNPS